MCNWLQQANSSVAGAVALIVIGASIGVAAPAFAGTKERAAVADYLRDGYAIVTKDVETVRRPGEAPYENLERVLQVTTYSLAKETHRVACVLTYDSQRETLDQTCSAE